MTNKRKSTVIKSFTFCLGLIIIGTFCFSYYCYNGSTGGYDEGTESPGLQTTISMKVMVIEGAGFLFLTNAKVQTILNQVECQDIKEIDFIELSHSINNAITCIVNTKLTFEELIKIAELTPYNTEVIEKLKKFDYDTFLKKHGLNPFIFCSVREYLEKGDITGTYKHAYSNFMEIEQLLLYTHSAILENRLPELEIFWRLNELCAEETLFGSYIARIFKEINR